MIHDPSYSPDVEIDHNGRVVWARSIVRGGTVCIPVHMLAQIERQSRQSA